MSEKIVLVPKAWNEPDDELIDRLERVLEMARSGEMHTFHGAGLLAGGDVLTTTGPFKDIAAEIGAIEMIKMRMLSEV
mgnify:CR=1 FL=1|tara:strand:- start:5806 stop:6039 length:234 start_codon:yes stop_codon:yes gene_type:complete